MAIISKRHKGFTLAEVLITLGVIGVVAAMTIPTLIANYQKTQYVTQLKKAYTQFNQVLQQMSTDAGCTGDLKCMSEWGGGNVASTYSIGELIAKYYKISKNCKDNSNQGCMPSSVNQKYDGSGTNDTGMDQTWQYKFITVDGFAFNVTSFGDNCASNDSNGKFGYLLQNCGDLTIDINGPLKGPNRWGRDLFYFFISNGKGPLLYPSTGVDHNWWHWPDNTNGCNSASGTNQYCSARVIEEGWQMNY